MLGGLKQVNQKIDSIIYRVKAKQYKRLPVWKNHIHNVPYPATDWEALDQDIQKACRDHGVPYKTFEVDKPSYDRFKSHYALPAMSLYALNCREKKFMEHYVAFTLLGLKAGERYVDIASESSPFPEMARQRSGIDAYSQDLSYPDGIRGHQIGSSADSMPVPDAWADKASLQCAFEHFEGPIDTNFMKEISRVLKPGGKCVIVPLYTEATPLNIYDPILYKHYDINKADDTATVIAEIGLGGYFERVYSPETLDRILLPDLGLNYTIYKIEHPESAITDRSAHSVSLVQRIRYALLVEKTN